MNNDGKPIENVALFFHSNCKSIIINYDRNEALICNPDKYDYCNPIKDLPTKDINRIGKKKKK